MLKLILAITAVFVSTPATSADAQFAASPAGGEHEYSALLEPLVAAIASDLNATVAVPETVNIVSGPCETANAFFVPRADAEPARLVLCTELLTLIANQNRAQQLDFSSAYLAFFSQVGFVLLHEAGHALIRLLDLPVVGQEEDAADQFATLMMSAEPVLAMWAARMWNAAPPGMQSALYGSFSDNHDLGPQRFYNIQCWTYGADPLTRAYVARGASLPDERARTCPDEFDRMNRAWQTLLGSNAKPGRLSAASARRNATGDWRFVESMESAADPIRCSASGTLELWQIGETLMGTTRQEGTCTIANIPVENNLSATISAGGVTADAVEFQVESCVYSGRFENEARMSLDGTVRCDVEGVAEPVVGTWRAVR